MSYIWYNVQNYITEARVTRHSLGDGWSKSNIRPCLCGHVITHNSYRTGYKTHVRNETTPLCSSWPGNASIRTCHERHGWPRKVAIRRDSYDLSLIIKVTTVIIPDVIHRRAGSIRLSGSCSCSLVIRQLLLELADHLLTLHHNHFQTTHICTNELLARHHAKASTQQQLTFCVAQRSTNPIQSPLRLHVGSLIQHTTKQESASGRLQRGRIASTSCHISGLLQITCTSSTYTTIRSAPEVARRNNTTTDHV